MSERDSSSQQCDTVVLGLVTDEMKLDIDTMTVYRVIRLLCVDLLLRRPSDHLSGEDAIPTDFQVTRKNMSHVTLLLVAYECARLCCHSLFFDSQFRILQSISFPILDGGDAEYRV